MIDEGHNNLHTTKTTYATLSGVLKSAGFRVMGYNGTFDERSLIGTDLLIISNPFADIRDSIIARASAAKQPFRWSDAASKSAYTLGEAAAVEQWVEKGGSHGSEPDLESASASFTESRNAEFSARHIRRHRRAHILLVPPSR